MNLKRSVFFFGANVVGATGVKFFWRSLEAVSPGSSVFPLTDRVFPGKDRLAAAFRSEGSPKSGFSVHDSSGRPFRVIAMIDMRRLDGEIAASDAD